MNQDNPNQLFLGTYRLYRTNNAKAPTAGDVTWKPISPDLTDRLHRPGAERRPRLRHLGDRRRRRRRRLRRHRRRHVWYSPDAQTADTPTWTQVDPKAKTLPNRPVATFAVDRSN